MLARAAIAGVIAIALGGCAHSGQQADQSVTSSPVAETRSHGEGGSAPTWVNDLPRDKDALYAIGISGPTFYAEDAVKYAADNARVELSRAVSSHVTTAFLEVTSSSGSYSDSAGVVDATHDYSDTILANSEIVATWVDRGGSYSGTSGTVYALARLDLKKARLPAPPPKAANSQ